jgi:hypothetical protein
VRSPSTPPTGACGHGAPYSVPWITIVTADRRSIQPTVPLDGCLVSQRVAKAFDGLRWRNDRRGQLCAVVGDAVTA